jgi:hypothetical protein
MRRVAVFLSAAGFSLALTHSSPGASRDLPNLFPIKQDGKWGFIDRAGKVVVSRSWGHHAQRGEAGAGSRA